ncbi:MAG: hypothetical protein R3335_01620 [Anaerolineales bacterium]|nr:hypothetical protein [Anaerolineales bacterium]
MTARHWTLGNNGVGPALTQGDTSQILRVIRGSGEAIVNNESHPLVPDTAIWLKPGDSYRFLAGDEGLEILQGQDPGDDP